MLKIEKGRKPGKIPPLYSSEFEQFLFRGKICKWDKAFQDGWKCLSKNLCEHKSKSGEDPFLTDRALKMEGWFQSLFQIEFQVKFGSTWEKLKPIEELNELASQSADLSGPSSAGLIKTDTSEAETSEAPEFRCFHCDEMIPSHLIKQHWDQCLTGNSISGPS